jgi:cell division protein FtsI/penicillin-binding protein 2
VPLRRPKTVIAIGIVIVVAAAVAVPVTLTVRRNADRDRMRQVATAFAQAWKAGTLAKVAYTGATGTDVASKVAAITAGLTPQAKDLPAAVEVAHIDDPKDGKAVEQLRVRWDLGQGRSWSYDTSATLRSVSGTWRVEWTPLIVHPKLPSGTVLSATRVLATRGQILGADGQVLVTDRPVVEIGIEPGRATDKRTTAATVAKIVDVDAKDLTARVLASPATSFVDVITLRRPDYEAVKAALQPIPGTVFRETNRSLAPTADFARGVLGNVGPATKEIVDAAKGRVVAGDVTGLAGIQRTYDERLAGTAGLVVKAVPAAGATAAGTTADSTAPPAEPLFEAAAVPGKPVTLTLDLAMQQAAEAALAAAPKAAALVALRASTGEVLAAANGGPEPDGYNRALLGQYPPGSTFKVATAYALLQAGITPQTPIPCPPSISVGGRTFTNAEDEVLGTVPFQQDFAHSCNTAFVGSHARITQAQLQSAAGALGYQAKPSLGLATYMGSVPAAADTVEHAASMIGQAKVLASPLSVATVSATVAAGRHHPTRLVTDPAPADLPAEGPELPTSAVTALRAMMREVVTEGTASAAQVGLRTLPGPPVYGKTGTAEFGTQDPPETHAWFTGYRGDIAFAAVVEGGGFGAKAAGPLIADFLRRTAA